MKLSKFLTCENTKSKNCTLALEELTQFFLSAGHEDKYTVAVAYTYEDIEMLYE